jgi:hypothetical protein
MRCSLFVPYKDVPERRIIEFIIDRQHHTAWVAKDNLDSFALQ